MRLSRRYTPPSGDIFSINQVSPQSVGLVTWLPMQSQGRISDFSGRGKNATLPGGSLNPSFSNSTVRGHVITFDGNDDYLDLGTSSEFNLNNYTVSVWIKTSGDGLTANFQKIAYKGNSSTKDTLSLYLSSGRAVIEYYNAGPNYFAQSLTDLRDGRWHHIVGTRRAGVAMNIYVDGRSIATGGDGGDTTTVANALVLGQRSNGDSEFKGQMSDFRIYNRPMGNSEVFQMYEPSSRWDLYKIKRRTMFARNEVTGLSYGYAGDAFGF